MSDEELTPTQRAHYEYCDELVREMHDLFIQHEALVDEYNEAMKFIDEKNWRQGYVHWVGTRDSVEGTGDIDG